MNAIILAPGPSLMQTFPWRNYNLNRRGEKPDMLIGVNRAATATECTHWTCGDSPLIEKIHEQVVGSPVLVTYNVSRDTLRDHKFTWRGEVETWTGIAESNWLHTSQVNWPWCSFTSAIVYASWKGATEIECYGCDWEGTADWDGTEAGGNRRPDRWKQERELFTQVSHVLSQRGCTVRRIQPVPATIDGYA